MFFIPPPFNIIGTASSAAPITSPELSYAVRELKCVAGINVTASHNPPEYNVYKVYWEDGAQITPPHDTGIMDEVKAVTDYNTVKTMSKDDAVKQGLYQQIGKDIDDKYIEELKKQVIQIGRAHV